MNVKFIALLTTLLPFATIEAQVQEETIVETHEVTGGVEFNHAQNTVEKNDTCHWSVQIHGGFNRMNNLRDYNHGICGNWCLQPMFGAQAEYTFTQYWGLGFDFTYDKNKQTWYNENLYDFSIFASVNVSNLLAPHRIWDKFSAYVNFGFGTSVSSWKDAYYIEDDIKHEIGDDHMWTRPFIEPGLNLEYNFNEYLAAGININAMVGLGEITNTTNNSIFHPTTSGGKALYQGGIELRYKFGGIRNIRNMALTEECNCGDELRDQLDLINKQASKMDSIAAAQNERIAKLAAENESLKETVNKQQANISHLDSLSKEIANNENKVIGGNSDNKVVNRANGTSGPTEQEIHLIKTYLSDLRFETNKAVIKKQSYSALDKLADLIGDHSEWNVMLSGYTDNTGDETKNLKLSESRAAAVKAYLVKKGIQSSRIQAVGYGSQNPIASNDTPEGREKNRRVELFLYTSTK